MKKYLVVLEATKTELIIRILVVVAVVATLGFLAGLFWGEVDSVRHYRDALDSLNATLDAMDPR